MTHENNSPAGSTDIAPMCEWYALCDHTAIGTVNHPVIGDVPVCQRCADKHDMTVIPFGRTTKGDQ